MDNKLGKIVEKYNPDMAFAYGSGVFKQQGYQKEEKPMLDFIFVVDDTKAWHRQNIDKHPEDYSSLARIFGTHFTQKIHNRLPHIYFNPFVTFEESTLKYGVVSTEKFLHDLKEWESFYLAGRFQKPVKALKIDKRFNQAQAMNLGQAVSAALLLNPKLKSTQDLYTTIASLSYLGDPRMKGAENPNKVNNIVAQNGGAFGGWYERTLENHPGISSVSPFILGQTPYGELIRSLPKSVFGGTSMSASDLEEKITHLVSSSAKKQLLGGLLTSGVKKSWKYVASKRKKAKSAA